MNACVLVNIHTSREITGVTYSVKMELFWVNITLLLPILYLYPALFGCSEKWSNLQAQPLNCACYSGIMSLKINLWSYWCMFHACFLLEALICMHSHIIVVVIVSMCIWAVVCASGLCRNYYHQLANYIVVCLRLHWKELPC